MNKIANYIIVGNRFSAISNQTQILTYTELLESIHHGTIKNGRLNIEQGISEEQVSWLKRLIQKYHLNNAISITSYFDEFERCPHLFNHKARHFNTLISTPREIDRLHFYSVLMIDDRCAEMSDHVTGSHIQMMLLVEAARQMVLATTEKFFIESTFRGKLSFIANSVESTFTQFVFPFFTEVHCHVMKQRILAPL